MSNSSSEAVSDTHSVTGRLCEWVHSVKLSDIPKPIRERAAHLMLDGIACALAGSRLPWSDTAVNAVKTFEAAGSCTLIGRDEKLSAMGATILNSTFIQGFEIDDFHAAAPLHSNSLLLPSLMAAYQQTSSNSSSVKVTGAELLLAYIVGYEIGPRVGLSLYGSDILSRGWHSGTVFGPAAVAAATGKLLQLNPAQLEDAEGIACTQACGLMSAQFGSMVKRMQHGFAARNGLFATLVARQGYTGIKNVFDQTYGGFLACFGDQTRDPPYLIEEVVRDLGQTWQLEGIKVKLYAAVAATHGAINCMANLQQKHAAELSQLDKITDISVELSSAAFEHGGWAMDPHASFTSLSAQMNVAYVLAAQLLDGEVSMAQFSTSKLNRPGLRSIISKVKPVHNKEYDVNPSDNLRTKVTVKFEDGKQLAEELHAAKGIDPPATNDDIVEKFRELTKDICSGTESPDIEKLILNIEDVESVDKIFELLNSSVKSSLS